MTIKRKRLAAFLYLMALAALLWPALVSRQPLFFPDSVAYLEQPLRFIEGITGRGVDKIEADSGNLSTEAALPVDASAGSGSPHRFILGGRSPFYGVLAVSGFLLGSLWISIILQGLIILCTFTLLYRLFRIKNPLAAPASVILLSGISTLPFFASYLMPDFLTGITILAAAALLYGSQQMSAKVRLAWFLVLTYSLCTHSSHIGISILMLAFASLYALLPSRSIPWRNTGVTAVAIVSALGAQFFVNQTINVIYGTAPINPPFLTARLAEDPAGLRYLQETCPENGFAVCRFLGKLPVYSDEFLWSRDPDVAVFATANPETRAALASEQFRFAASVLWYDPAGTIRSSLIHFGQQLSRFGVIEFRISPYQRKYIESSIQNNKWGYSEDYKIGRGVIDLEAFDQITHPFLYISIILIVAVITHSMMYDYCKRFYIFVMLSMLGVISNAAITGMLSTVHDRYQARVVWIIPALAILCLIYARKHHIEKSYNTM